MAEWEGSFSVRNGGTAPERVVLVPAGRGAELILELPPALGSGTVLVVPPDSDWPVSVRLRGAALENGDEAFMAVSELARASAPALSSCKAASRRRLRRSPSAGRRLPGDRLRPVAAGREAAPVGKRSLFTLLAAVGPRRLFGCSQSQPGSASCCSVRRRAEPGCRRSGCATKLRRFQPPPRPRPPRHPCAPAALPLKALRRSVARRAGRHLAPSPAREGHRVVPAESRQLVPWLRRRLHGRLPSPRPCEPLCEAAAPGVAAPMC